MTVGKVMFHKKVKKVSYDKENLKPIIKASICNGEQVAGFKDVHTGKFTEIMVIQNPHDLADFLEKYDIDAGEIKKEY